MPVDSRPRVSLPDVADSPDLAQLRLDLVEANKELSALHGQVATLQQDYRGAVNARDFIGQSHLTGTIGTLPSRIAAAKCKALGIEAQIADLEFDAMVNEKNDWLRTLGQANEHLVMARNDVLLNQAVVNRIENRLLALIDQKRSAKQRAEQVAYEATQQIGRDASALLKVA